MNAIMFIAGSGSGRRASWPSCSARAPSSTWSIIIAITTIIIMIIIIIAIRIVYIYIYIHMCVYTYIYTHLCVIVLIYMYCYFCSPSLTVYTYRSCQIMLRYTTPGSLIKKSHFKKLRGWIPVTKRNFLTRGGGLYQVIACNAAVSACAGGRQWRLAQVHYTYCSYSYTYTYMFHRTHTHSSCSYSYIYTY